jgi:hypothetical protein
MNGPNPRADAQRQSRFTAAIKRLRLEIVSGYTFEISIYWYRVLVD